MIGSELNCTPEKRGRGGGGGKTRREWADSVVPYMHIRRKLVEQKVAQPRGSRGMLPAPSENVKNFFLFFFSCRTFSVN